MVEIFPAYSFVSYRRNASSDCIVCCRGQEKIFLLDGKVTSLLEVDHKVERVADKLEETDHKLAAIGKALDEQKDGPLLSEFTTRGVLSTLKVRVIMRRILNEIPSSWN
jgi:hypothetical protein